MTEFNTMHPVLAAPTVGLFVVGMTALLLPSGIARAHAWGLFISTGVGAGIGRWIYLRARQGR